MWEDNDDWNSTNAGNKGREDNYRKAQPNSDSGWGGNRQQDSGWGSNDKQDSGWGDSRQKGSGWGSNDKQDSGWGSNQDSGWDSNNNQDSGWGSNNKQDSGWGSGRQKDFSSDLNSRSGGFRGSGDSRGDMTCYKCQGTGHMARDCPQADGGDNSRGSRGPMTCYKCQQSGHMARDCPQSDGGGGGFRGSGGSRGDMTCYKCQGTGHMARDCPQSNGGDNFRSSGNSRGPMTCYKCQQTGHMARDCPQADGGGNQDFQSRVFTNKDADPPRPSERYVPVEVAESDLYQDGISSGINFQKYRDIRCSLTGDNPVNPLTTFAASGLCDKLLASVDKCGYKEPTPVQKYSLPVIMAGRDMMACAQTGSGKTAAFMLPIINYLMGLGVRPEASSRQTPYCLVLAPTRELAIQTYNETRKFSLNSSIRSVVIYGGTSVNHQLGALQGGCHILIATPGRLNDFVARERISFENLKFLVLDEADRMLDMGFQGDIDRIVKHRSMPDVSTCERQTLLFSATFPPAIQRLAADYMRDYLFLEIGVVGAASGDVVQRILEVNYREKRNALTDLLREIGFDKKVLVFVDTKRMADFLASHLCQENFPTTSIHGDRLQREREEALSDFRRGRKSILIATSVASRGLDIKGVAHVVNYDLPNNIDDYVHRIGRTGRVGNIGTATSFYDSSRDSSLAPDLARILQDSGHELPECLQAYSSRGGGGYGDMDGFTGDVRGSTNHAMSNSVARDLEDEQNDGYWN